MSAICESASVSKDVIKSRAHSRQRAIDTDDRDPRAREGAQWLSSVPIGFADFQSDARLARAKRLALLSLVEAFIAINWVTTQHAASVLHDASGWGTRCFICRD